MTNDAPDGPTNSQAIATQIRAHLATIRAAWANTADPMNIGHGTASGDPTMPSSTIVLRADITRTLAYWVHALIDERPSVIQHLEQRHYPTTDPAAYPASRLIVVTDTLDCTDVWAMADLLDREADDLAQWLDPQGLSYGQTLADELQPLAHEAALVSHPPRRDKITLGPCPACGWTLRAVAVRWVRRPQPTTDPAAYPLWTPYGPERDAPIECRGCKTTKTLTEWQAAILGAERLLSAAQLVEHLHERLGMRVSPITLRVWATRGTIQTRGHARDGRALYDRVQVLAALMERERRAEGA